MAINTYEMTCHRSPPYSRENSPKAVSSRLVKTELDSGSSNNLTPSSSKQSKQQKTKSSKSPYLNGDRVQLLSRVIEKRCFQKRTADFKSSFPLAATLYKASSDEFKSLKRANKKVRNSVLTLPNHKAPAPQECTVSDMNESEYFNRESDDFKLKAKKRNPILTKKKQKPGKNFEHFDRDARYCSRMNLECSSTDMIKYYNGHRGNKQSNNKLDDVWAALRNINKFQFRASPHMSESSCVSPKGKLRRRNARKNARVVETCHTEEIIISSIDLGSRSPRSSYSKTSSFDRVTVIDNSNELEDLCKKFQTMKHKVIGGRDNQRRPIAPKIKTALNTKHIQNKIPKATLGKTSPKIVKSPHEDRAGEEIMSKTSPTVITNIHNNIDNNKENLHYQFSCKVQPVKNDKRIVYTLYDKVQKQKMPEMSNKTQKKPVNIKLMPSENAVINNAENYLVLRKGNEKIKNTTANNFLSDRHDSVKEMFGNIGQVTLDRPEPDKQRKSRQAIWRKTSPKTVIAPNEESAGEAIYCEIFPAVKSRNNIDNNPDSLANQITNPVSIVKNEKRNVYSHDRNQLQKEHTILETNMKTPKKPIYTKWIPPENTVLRNADKHHALRKGNDKIKSTTANNYINKRNDLVKVMLGRKGTLDIPEPETERQSRQLTTMPSAVYYPKLTQMEFKKKLAQMRFPMVILGNDQISSSFEVVEYNQFEGLNKQIWPFMSGWTKEHIEKDTKHCQKDTSDVLCKTIKIDDTKNNINNAMYLSCKTKFNRELKTNTQVKDRKPTSNRQIMDQIMEKSKSIEQFTEKNTLDELSKNIKTDKSKNNFSNAMYLNGKPELDRDPSPQVNKKSVIIKKETLGNTYLNAKSQSGKKPKPIEQFKDKMLKFLFKKPSTPEVFCERYTCPEQYDNSKKNKSRNISTEVFCEHDKPYISNLHIQSEFEPMNAIDAYTETSDNEEINPMNMNCDKGPKFTRYSWCKPKQASDFIENIIQKIQNGIYYTHESCDTLSKQKDLSEKIVQTQLTIKPDVMTNFEVGKPELVGDLIIPTYNFDNDPLKNIPGFDETLSGLKIQTLNGNQFAVKHCVTNIMIQFDVIGRNETDSTKLDFTKSSTVIPLTVTQSHTRVFKSKKTLINAMLPAEICSILPKIIRNIMDTTTFTPHDSLTIMETASKLSTITEFSRVESKLLIPLHLPMLPHIRLSKQLQSYLNGKFSKQITMMKPLISRLYLSRCCLNKLQHCRNLLPIPEIRLDVFCETKLMRHLNICKIKYEEFAHNSNYANKSVPMDLAYAGNIDLCSTNNSGVIRNIFSNYNMINFMENFKRYFQSQPNVNIDLMYCNPSLVITHDSKHNTTSLDFSLKTMDYAEKRISITLNNAGYNEIVKNNASIISQNDEIDNNNFAQSIGIALPQVTRHDKKEYPKPIRQTNKVRRNFNKLYKKCKSTSNIVGERFHTPLDEIVNSEDFFQALGSGKGLSSVLDSESESRIISSLMQMKNWISEISQRQALLVLLLMNKKDTPNLIKRRPIILQGIALNRITMSKELDMEIEVIEKENFNKFPHCEGIPIFQALNKERHDLYEELCWIAKTTASDYQRPFNENSEKLLKSLLEKRKKLNPSYLRVMARYVGLGLLKSPKKLSE